MKAELIKLKYISLKHVDWFYHQLLKIRLLQRKLKRQRLYISHPNYPELLQKQKPPPKPELSRGGKVLIQFRQLHPPQPKSHQTQFQLSV